MALLIRLVPCKTVGEVIAAVNEYIRAWPDDGVPESCRPSMVEDAEDVFRAAAALERHVARLTGANSEVSHELDVTVLFFTAARKKIRRLQARVGRPS
jgi:hypothetical protein